VKPEEGARKKIDELLEFAGWQIQNFEDLNLSAGFGVAVREFPLKGTGFADYMLFVERHAVGVVEAKPVGTTLSGVSEQTEKYLSSFPEILKVHFHSFRHFKATITYHDTKDLIYVQEPLGHKNIEITRSYIYIEKSLFKSIDDDKFFVKVAKSKAEITALLEQGFEYITQKDGLA